MVPNMMKHIIHILMWSDTTSILVSAFHNIACTVTQKYIFISLTTLSLTTRSQQFQLGSVSYSMSLTLCVMLSGNLISNETMRSPFRLGSLGNGSPWPWIRFTVVGFTISSIKLIGIFSPVSVGTLMIVPHNACNESKTVNLYSIQLIHQFI